MYLCFHTSYYQISRERNELSFQLNSFLRGFTLITIDCLRQNESVKSGIVDVRLEFEFKENVSTNTIGYCLIIHDRVIKYSSMSNVVQDYVNYHFREKVLSPLISI